MKRSTYIWALFVALSATFLGCDRDNFDSGYEEFYGEITPYVEFDTAVNSFFRTASMNLPLIRGEGSVEVIDGRNFIEVKLTVGETDQPFALGWYTDHLVPGEYEGAIFTINLDNNAQNPLGPNQINSGFEWREGTSFTVKLNLIGDVGETITGTYAGMGELSDMQGLVEFDGAFNVTRVQ